MSALAYRPPTGYRSLLQATVRSARKANIKTAQARPHRSSGALRSALSHWIEGERLAELASCRCPPRRVCIVIPPAGYPMPCIVMDDLIWRAR